MNPLLSDILSVLELERLEDNLFRGQSRDPGGKRVFGGQVLGQALRAATATVGKDRTVHSLHAYFLRPGDTGRAVVFQVDPLQDGRTFSRRRVTAIQGGRPILCLEASFTTDQSITEYQVSPPAVPAPEDCPAMVWRFRATGLRPDRPFDLRAAIAPDAGPPHFSDDLWFRTRGDWDGGPDQAGTVKWGPVSRTAILTYVSDLTFVSGILRPLGRPDVPRLTSLDHVMWFHNEPRLDDWLLFTKSTPASGELRGLAQGSIFHRDGTLIATMAQEGLVHH